MPDLAAEAAAAGRQMQGRLPWFDAVGIFRGFVFSGGRGVDRVRFITGGMYEPCEEGVEALILGVWSDRPNFSSLVDMVAIEIAGGGRWGSRLGIAVALGGWSAQTLSTSPVSVFQSPWRWLQAQGEGLPERRWLDRDWIPDHAVSLLGGDGGAGKRLLALQLDR